MKLADVKIALLPPYQMRVYAEGCPFLSTQLIREGIYERSETAVTCQVVKPGDTVLDIGANIGYYSLLTSKLVGAAGQVFAFEPEKENFQILKWNIDNLALENTTCVNVGVSNFKGKAALYLCADNPGGHHLHEPMQAEKTQTVEIITIDDFLADKSQKVDYIKIDAQGAEQSILEGLQKTIEINRHNLKVLFEFAPSALNASAGGLALALQTMRSTFEKFMYIDDQKLSVSEISFDRITALGSEGLQSDQDRFANLLCFASVDAFQVTKNQLAGI